MSLSLQANRIFDRLPKDGTKVGGITLQRELELSKLEYQKARDELKEQALVISGAGRGGSLGRIEGVEPKKQKIVTKTERMEHAREAKTAQSRAKKELDREVEIIIKYFAQHGKQIERNHISYSDGRPVAAVWDKGHHRAKMFGIPQLEWDKLRAEYR